MHCVDINVADDEDDNGDDDDNGDYADDDENDDEKLKYVSVCRPIVSAADQPLLDQLFPPPGETWSLSSS